MQLDESDSEYDLSIDQDLNQDHPLDLNQLHHINESIRNPDRLENNDTELYHEPDPELPVTTRSGRVVKPPSYLHDYAT